MKLGDFIHQNLEKKALPEPARSALSATLPSLLALYLPPDDTHELAQSIEDYLRTEDFASAISNVVGEPKPDETEEQFVSRARSAIEEILTRRFGGTMKKLFDRFRLVRDATAQQIEKWSADLMALLRETAHAEAKLVEEYVAQVRRLNPDKTPLELAKRIMWRRSLKAGGIGGLCGVGGFITLPVTMPTNLYYTFRIQARLTLAVAHIYGWNITEDDAITDMLLVMGGSTSIEAAKSVGVSLGQEFAKKAVEKYITRDVMKKINSVISRKIITKAGEKSLLSFAELVPLVGAPIGAGFDFFGTLVVGRAAIKFYST